jgi:hypothetical protein
VGRPHVEAVADGHQTLAYTLGGKLTAPHSIESTSLRRNVMRGLRLVRIHLTGTSGNGNESPNSINVGNFLISPATISFSTMIMLDGIVLRKGS